jgi:hypothetical protein
VYALLQMARQECRICLYGIPGNLSRIVEALVDGLELQRVEMMKAYVDDKLRASGHNLLM